MSDTIRSKTDLKGRFLTGCIPTQSDFDDLITTVVASTCAGSGQNVSVSSDAGDMLVNGVRVVKNGDSIQCLDNDANYASLSEVEANQFAALCASFFCGPAGVILQGVILQDTGTGSSVRCGSGNAASGYYATVSGGRCNTASCSYSTVSGGCSNTASGRYAAVGGGRCNTASGSYSTVSGGYSNTASGVNGGILGGSSNNLCDNADAFIIGSNICANAVCTTFVNNLCAFGTIAGGAISGAVCNLAANAVLDSTYNYVFTSGAICVTLPDAATSCARAYNLKKADSGTNLTLCSCGGLIDGQTSLLISDQYTAMTLVSNGISWGVF